MSWINDVTHELQELKINSIVLRKFGITIGIILILVIFSVFVLQ